MTASDQDTMFTEVLDPGHPRPQSNLMEDTIKKEIEVLVIHGAFKVVDKDYVTRGANILPCKFILAIKLYVEEMIRYKARYFIGVHRDRRKDYLVHSFQTEQPWSTRLLLSLSEMNDFNLWTAHVLQAYLQTYEPLRHDVFITDVPSEFNFSPNQFLKLI